MVTWVALSRDKYRTTHNGETWYLTATPKADKPWLLHTERRDRTQEIGAPDPLAARHAADIWFELSEYFTEQEG
ncbi:hypothetical protein JOF56_001924 [Kibdelosporangium banguiense]|uniref:Integrase n=1 Tax=Kibdelosporangium banguiense TaxID=1365924 RepID=A0ABS4TAU3_9PSEU|nr:hypothetical protein [Kibdelosporangium banguiense]MBP2321539.1 hypothetical protein [Kibdelosporangium banguiense]